METGPTLPADAAPRLLIVDGHAYAYRAFFAIRSLSSPSGKPTNAIYGFIRMLAKARERLQPSHVIVIWDGGLADERMALLPEYKAQRPATPSDLEQQFDQIVAYLQASGVFSLLKEGHEADDCIAAIAGQAVAGGMDVVIASSDKDFMQLITDRIKMLNPNDKSDGLMGIAEVKNKTGVAPEQVVDWLSLIGDSVDNIPGVPGVGPKTATDLLTRFASIDALYARLGEVSSERLRNNLQASEPLLRRNQSLVRLRHETECGVRLDDLVVKPGNVDLLARHYEEWGFKTLLRELQESRDRSRDFFDESGLKTAQEPALLKHQ